MPACHDVNFSFEKLSTIYLVKFAASWASCLDFRELLADLSQRSCEAVSLISLARPRIF
jgi:hypothetical protein